MGDSKVGSGVRVPFHKPLPPAKVVKVQGKSDARQDSLSTVKGQQARAPQVPKDVFETGGKQGRRLVSLDAPLAGARALSQPAPANRQPGQSSVADRIARCIGIWETNRGKDNPAPKESSLDTVAGVHASMATIEQATMPYAVSALKSHPELRDKADPPLTMGELQDANARCRAVEHLLSSVTKASSRGQAPSEFISQNAAAISATGLANEDVETMFRAATLKGTLDTAHSSIKSAGESAQKSAAKEKKTSDQQHKLVKAAKAEALKKAISEIPESQRLGLGEGSLKAYINDSKKWGENRAAWQRKAVNAMPGDVGKRIEAVAVSESGAALALPVIQSRVDEQLARRPVPSEEEIIKNVAQQNNRHEVGYGKHVWETYQRLYPEAAQ